MNNKTKNIVLTGTMAAVICVLSVWQIPLPLLGVPLTFQVFAVCLSGYFLGAKKGVIATAVYILIGAVGLPVFSGFRGGFSVLAGPSGGFVFGFLLIAFFAGLSSGKGRGAALLFGLMGILLCHTVGVLQLMIVADTSLISSLLTVSLPYIPKDMLLAFAAYLFSGVLKRKITV